jgi:predicted nucleotidyltransferase
MVVSEINETRLQALKEYFDKRGDIAFAFFFGSATKGRIRKDGDIDIAVYFKPEKDIEWEVRDRTYEGERRIGLDMERLFRKEVDLIVLNRARAVLADEIIRKGMPIVVKDKGMFLDFLCIITDEIEYVRDWLGAFFKTIQKEKVISVLDNK